MDHEWELLQLAQRAFSAGDLSGAKRFAEQSCMGFELSKARSGPEVLAGDRQNRVSYRERIEQRLQEQQRHEEDLPEPLDERETGMQAAKRLIEAVILSTSEGRPLGPGAPAGQAAVLGHLREDGTAEISVYLPSLEAEDDVYFDRLCHRVLESAQQELLPRVYVDHMLPDAKTDTVQRMSVTLVAQASVCRLFATSVPHFQVIGEMIAPVAEAQEACGAYVKLLDSWLNPKEKIRG